MTKTIWDALMGYKGIPDHFLDEYIDAEQGIQVCQELDDAIIASVMKPLLQILYNWSQIRMNQISVSLFATFRISRSCMKSPR
jgi:hypothetical protein